MFNYQGVTKKAIKGVWTNSLNDSLISYWRLDENTGVRYDAVSTNNLSPQNSPNSTQGKIRKAVSLTTASNQYLDASSNSSLQTGDIDMTIAGWVNPRSFNNSQQDISIASKMTPGTTTPREYFIEMYGPATYHFRFVFGAADLDSAETVIELGKWLFFVCWHDSVANTVNYQLNNGTVRSVSHSSGTTANNLPFNIGAGVVDRYFDGEIDEVGFWKRVLTSDERATLWNNGLGTTRPY